MAQSNASSNWTRNLSGPIETARNQSGYFILSIDNIHDAPAPKPGVQRGIAASGLPPISGWWLQLLMLHCPEAR